MTKAYESPTIREIDPITIVAHTLWRNRYRMVRQLYTQELPLSLMTTYEAAEPMLRNVARELLDNLGLLGPD